MRVRLSPTEQAIAKYLARMREKLSREGGLVDRKRDPHRDGMAIDLDGAGAELAAAKVLNVCPLLNVARGPDRGFDLSKNGACIQVKHTRYPNGQLLVRDRDRGADLYLLVTGEFPDYDVVGYADSSIFSSDNLANPGGYGPCYMLPQSSLKPVAIEHEMRLPGVL